MRLSERGDGRFVLRRCVLLFLLMFSARLIYSLIFPPKLAFSTTDCERYYYSGLYFGQTGQVCYPVPVRTAWIMPGISVLIGALSRLFPDEGSLLWAIRICWILIGSLAPVYIFRSADLFIPWPASLLAASCYLLPWYIQIDVNLQTEGPAFAFFAAALYYGLRSGYEPDRLRHTLCFSVFLILGILFRASNVLLVPCILIWQLFCRRAPLRTVLRNAAVIGGVLLVCLLPWTVRNARIFHGFIPLTYTAGDTVYEGSFYGPDAPTDDELFEQYAPYDAHAEVRRGHPALFDAEGNPVDDSAEQYAHHLYLELAGKYRVRGWFSLRPLQFLKTYFYLKPKSLLNDAWYWDQVFGISLETAVRLRQANLFLCLFAGLLSLLLKKLQGPVWFLGLTYVVNLYIVAFSLPLDRYGQAIMPYRLLLAAIGVYLFLDLVKSKRRHGKQAQAV